GRLTFTAEGPLQSDLRVKAQITARGLDAAAEGTARYVDGAVTGTLRTTVKEADLRPLFGVSQSVLARFSGDMTLAKDRLTLASATGTVAGANLRGRAAIGRALPHSIDAYIDADDINAAAIVAALTGWPEAAVRGDAQSNLWAWPVDPFARGLAADYRGKVVLRSQRAAVTPAWLMRELRATLTLGDAEAKITDLSGGVSGGRVAGTVSLQRGGEGLRADVQMKLTDADAAMLLPAAARPPVSGRVGLDVALTGTGLSPNALVGSLAGSGKVVVDGAQFGALDPHAFEAVMRAADRGLPLDAIRVRDFMSKALDGGQLPVRHAEGALDVASGQVRLQNLTADADGAALAVSGNLDLTQGLIDARLVLTGKADLAGSKPDVFMGLRGPLGAATRTIDVSALSGWLTLRNVDIQAKKLEAIEAAQQKPEAPPIAPSPEIPALMKSEPTPAPPAASHSVAPSAPPLPPAQTIAPAPRPAEPRPRAAQPSPQPPAAAQQQRPAARPPLQLVPQQN
ncbi:MAG: AsmA family protein, partial [Pseudolabrys sp.]